MKSSILFLISFFLFCSLPVFIAKETNCTDPLYYFSEALFIPDGLCWSDCQCDGSRYCNEDNECTGIARVINPIDNTVQPSSQAPAIHPPEPEPDPKDEPIETPSEEPLDDFCDESEMAINSFRFPNSWVRADKSNRVNLQWKANNYGRFIADDPERAEPYYQFEKWIAHFNADSRSWCFEHGNFKKKYLSLNITGCPDKYAGPGCGTVSLSTSCGDNEKFILTVFRNYTTLSLLNKPNRYLRLSGKKVTEFNIRGSGIVNSNYRQIKKSMPGYIQLQFFISKKGKCHEKPQAGPGVCDGSTVGFYSISNKKHFLSGTSAKGVKVQVGYHGYQHFILHYANQTDQFGNPLWCIEMATFATTYMSIDVKNCLSIPMSAGCGNIGMADQCGDNEKFAIVKSSDGNYGLQSKTYPNRFVRIDGSNCPEGRKEGGCGIVNTQYYYDPKGRPANSESFGIHVQVKGKSCKK